MKYWFGIVAVYDGEYQYYHRYLSVAEDRDMGIELIMKDCDEWTANDWRETRLVEAREISKGDFDVLQNYLYVQT